MNRYEERLAQGKNAIHVTPDFRCSECGEQLCSGDDMGAYYDRREHFESKHGMNTAEARYSALNVGGGDVSNVAVNALSSFSQSFRTTPDAN